MKAIRKYPGEGAKVVDIKSVDQIRAELGNGWKKIDIARDASIFYDGAWRESGKPRNTVLCGMELGGVVFIVGNAESGIADLPNVDGVLYTCFLTVRYENVDKINNVWKCRHCDYLQKFEADGPFENGWNVCPSCGGILQRPKVHGVEL